MSAHLVVDDTFARTTTSIRCEHIVSIVIIESIMSTMPSRMTVRTVDGRIMVWDVREDFLVRARHAHRDGARIEGREPPSELRVDR